MLKNYFKIAIRNLIRHKAFSVLNISGLAIGMASSILILLWVQNEWSYDRFHANAGQLYRLNTTYGNFQAAVGAAGMPAVLQQTFPQIRSTVRVSHMGGGLFSNGDRRFDEKRVFYADSNFLQVFSFGLLEGNAATALQRPDGILITESMAHKYFGSSDALGKTLLRGKDKLVTVTGVLKDIPGNTHLQFDLLMPLSAEEEEAEEIQKATWVNFDFYNYLLLDKNFKATPAALHQMEAVINKLYKERVPQMAMTFTLQPITDIHLHSHLQIELPGGGNNQYVQILFWVAIFILVVACINFMNLSTARSARRAKEVGLRKVVGALRRQLIGQFLGEALLLSFLAMAVAILLVSLVLPLFNDLAGKQLALSFTDVRVLAGLFCVAVLTGLVSGSYPALFLSGFQPVKVLKGSLRSLGANVGFRNVLVVTQFVVSIVLLVGTIVIFRQLAYIRDRQPGYDKANLLYMTFSGELFDKQDVFRDALRQNPLTSQVCFVSALPTNNISGEVDVRWAGKDPKSQPIFANMNIDDATIDVFRMQLISGRNFSSAFKGDTGNFIINQKAVEVMGMTPATVVGKELYYRGVAGKVIGVVKDFNYKPIQHAIDPMVMDLAPFKARAVIRVRPENVDAVVRVLTRINQQLNPGYPLQYGFLDEDLNNQYRGEQQMGKLFNLFAVLAIFISCLGLYGLSAFMAQQRSREIGVRKVLGASLGSILYMLSASYARLVGVAILIAVPLSWWAFGSWLGSFAYHVEMGWVTFAAASMAALLIAWGTVSYESMRVALANPVDSLKAE